MMEKKKDNTEEKILNAAHEVFIRKGMDGARMQEIADEAGINKALLHYYFRTKEKLFEATFSRVVKFVFPGLTNIAREEIDFVSKLDKLIDAYFDLLLTHPFLPGFLIKELNRDPASLFKLVKKHGLNPSFVMEPLTEAMERGEIKKVDPQHLVVSIVSMCVFPFAVRPILGYLFFQDDEDKLKTFYKERAAVIKKFVIDSIVIEK